MCASRKNVTIAVSGKGGVGKTTIAAMILKYLTSKQPLPNILVLDVDADTNMPDVLAIDVDRGHTVGGIAQELKERINKGKLEPSFNKASYLESKCFEIMIEEDDFDMIVMSKSEGEGCYCFINSTVTGILDTIQSGYHYVLIDTPAGLEHFSRRTMTDIDHLFIVTDPSSMGMHTAERIIELAEELTLNVENMYIIGNRFTKENEKYLVERFSSKGDKVKVLGIVPHNTEIQDCNLAGKSLLKISDTNESYQLIYDYLSKILN
ncbi:MAG: AAA family ATPase [Candidatus Hodarchaeota archaeon]